jgi:hypothetical protein
MADDLAFTLIDSTLKERRYTVQKRTTKSEEMSLHCASQPSNRKFDGKKRRWACFGLDDRFSSEFEKVKDRTLHKLREECGTPAGSESAMNLRLRNDWVVRVMLLKELR